MNFMSNNIKFLTADDFNLTSKELITIKINDCILILFYINNEESNELGKIFNLAAQQTAGPLFGMINMITERKVAENFMKVKNQLSNPLNWAGLQQYP